MHCCDGTDRCALGADGPCNLIVVQRLHIGDQLLGLDQFSPSLASHRIRFLFLHLGVQVAEPLFYRPFGVP